MIKLRFISRVALIVALLSVFALSITAQSEENVLRVNWGPNDIPSLDPSDATDVSSIQIIVELFPGLTRINEVTLENQPGMALDWTVSEDGLTYTLNLIEDVPWVKYNMETGEVEEVLDDDGNVRYVTAADFAYGMQTSMDPRTGSYYGGILATWIEGGADFNGALDGLAEDASEEEAAEAVAAAAEGIAVTVIDDYTLEVVASQPAGFVPQILGMWMSTAKPQWVEEEFGDAWTEPENIVSYGPFALSEWLNGERLTIVRNPFWPGTDTIPVPTLDAVTGVMLETSAALANYEAGLLDTTGVPSADLDRVLADATLSEEYSTGPDTCTFYLMFNTTIEPTNDVRVRQALSMAINRQDIADFILRPSEPAFFFTRPSLAAAPTAEEYPELIIGEDDEMANELITSYLEENGLSEVPTITFMHSAGSGTGPLVAAAALEMWNDALGGVVNIDVSTQEWAVYLETTDFPETAPNVWYLGWCQDYPDTNNFLFDVLHSSVAVNGSGWSDEEFDALLSEAQVLTDLEEREALYAQAEYIATTRDAMMINLVYDLTSNLTKPYIERPYGSLGNTYYEYWSISN
ncbi:MAG: peptide ABC transporter substrate-binding protein [Anaerolineae bacterium]